MTPYHLSVVKATIESAKVRPLAIGLESTLGEVLEILARCKPIIREDAQMMAAISRFSPLSPEDQAKHDSTEYESEKLIRELDLIFGELT